MTTARGWDAETEQQKYREYCGRKQAAGAEPRDVDGWRQACNTWEESQRRGNALRDAAADRFRSDLGYTPDKGWTTEQYFRSTLHGKRFHDIGNEREQVGFEFKAGGVSREAAMRQLDKDQDALDQGYRVVWTVEDMSKVDGRVQNRIQQLREEEPRFEAVDLSDPASIADYRQRYPQEGRALEQAGQDFAAAELARTNPQAAEALRRSSMGSGRSAGAATSVPHPHPDPNQAAGRTTPAAETALRRQRAAGRNVNGPTVHNQGGGRTGVGK